MYQKILTISIAAYNAEDYIEKAMQSCVISNKENDLEVLIINDGSKDNTSTIAHKYAERHPNIFKVIDKENGGYGSTVNIAIQVASGKYIKLLDADDWYNTNNLEILLETLKKIDADMVVTDYVECTNNSKRKMSFPFPKKQNVTSIDVDCNIAMHAVCYRTEILRQNNIKLHENALYTDTEFVTYPLFYITTFYYLPVSVYQYSIGREGQSVSVSVRAKHSSDALKIYNALINYYQNCKIRNNTTKLIQRKIAESAKFYLYSLLAMNFSIDVKEKIKCFDRDVKNFDIAIYDMMKNRCISILRKSNYRMYWLCSVYIKYILK